MCQQANSSSSRILYLTQIGVWCGKSVSILVQLNAVMSKFILLLRYLSNIISFNRNNMLACGQKYSKLVLKVFICCD